MKIYTGTGDRGKTGLFSGERVAKDHARIEAYGDLDELNAVIGALRASLPADQFELASALDQIQSHLFEIGAWLATTPGAPAAQSLPPLDPAKTNALEQMIDRLDENLPPLKGFILPGGHPCAAWAHIARTVCRRAERRVVGLASDLSPNEPAEALQRSIVYLNRLSDYFFVLARHINRTLAVEEALWKR